MKPEEVRERADKVQTPDFRVGRVCNFNEDRTKVVVWFEEGGTKEVFATRDLALLAK
jgi:hypothetical protein